MTRVQKLGGKNPSILCKVLNMIQKWYRLKVDCDKDRYSKP